MTDIVKMDKVGAVEFVSSGIDEIDALVGGFPRGRVTQIYGLAATGKTTMMVMALANLSQSGQKVLFCDVENALNVDRVAELGADLGKVDYSALAGLEEVCELIRSKLHDFDLIVLDSIAMLTPNTESSGEIGQANIGVKSRLLGQWLRIITPELAKSKCALVLINQMRASLNMFGDPYVLPGGMQLKFSSYLMLKLSTNKASRIMKGKEHVGHWVNVVVEKNKSGPPRLETKFRIIY